MSGRSKATFGMPTSRFYTIVIILSVSFILSAPVDAQTEEKPLTSIEIYELGQRADNFSETGEGIGIIAIVGEKTIDQGISKEQIGQALHAIFAKESIPSEVHVGYGGSRPTSITFFTKRASFGPYGINGAMAAFAEVSQRYREEQSVKHLFPSETD